MPLESSESDAASLFRKIGITHHLTLLDHAWTSELGALARRARIVAVDHAALVVDVDSSTAMQELTLRRPELLRRVNRYFKDPFLKHIHFRMAQHGANGHG